MTNTAIRITRVVTLDAFATEITHSLLQAMENELTGRAKEADDEERIALKHVYDLLLAHPDGTVIQTAMHDLVMKALTGDFIPA